MTDNDTSDIARSRVVWVVVSIGALAIATLLVFSRLARSAQETSHPPAAAASHVSDTLTLAPEQQRSVITTAVSHGDLPVHASVPGRIEFNANAVTSVFAQFSGRVVRLDVEVGSLVRQGQPIAMLDSPDVVGMQADYQEALAAMRVAGTTHDQAARTRARAARLAEVEAIPIRELQEAQAAEARTTEDLRQADARRTAARSRLQIAGFGDEDIDRLESQGAAATTRLVPIKAPVAGTVTERHVGLGQVVQTGGDALLKIADLSTVWVTADVYEDQVAAIHPGARVTIQATAYPSETFEARVDRIGATLDPDKRTLAVRCVMPNAEGRLKPGMFASVALQSGTIRSALLVPASAIVAAGNRRTVFVETAAGYQEREVETGDEVGGWVVVQSGLHDGDRVVSQGGLLLARQMTEATNR